MKNNKFAFISVILSIILIIGFVYIPFNMIFAEGRDPYSYLVTSKLSGEWDAWNSMNKAVDKDGNKIKTEEYVNIVEDPTESGRGGVLKIGHADYKTSISLRVTQSTTVNYSHKYEALFYLDGSFAEDSYMLLKNSDAWGSGAQNRMNLYGMDKDKWVVINTENALNSVDGISGAGYTHISSGNATLIFSLVLDAGNYLYVDNLNLAAGNSKTYKKNINTDKGDTVIYTNTFEISTDAVSKESVTHIDEWQNWVDASYDSPFEETVGTVTEGDDRSLVFYNRVKDFRGSIIQNVIGLEDGIYSLSVDYRSNGYTSAVISAENYGGEKIQKAINEATEEFKTVTIEGIQVTDNRIDVTVYADGKAEEYLIVDNITLKKEGSDENFILNGDFESNYSVTVNPVEKGTTPENWGSWLNGTDAETQFIANEGYNSESSMAVVYPKDSSSNFNQTVLGLEAGKTYVVSAYVKFKGAGDARLYLKNWGASTNIKSPQSDTWVKIFREITLGENADRISLEFYCNAKAGDWFMVDNVRVFEKETPSVNLIKNGDFEKFSIKEDAPELIVDYKANIPNYRNWIDAKSTGKFENSVGYYIEDNNTRLAFYNKDSEFRGSINQDIPELENGEYTVSVKARTAGYKAAVISVMNYNKDNSTAKLQKSIVSVGEELTEISFNVPVTSNTLMVTVYVDGLAGQYLIIDDISVTAAESSENLVLNGDFETKEPAESKQPEKLADIAYGWDLWANDGDVSGMFVAKGGYNSDASFAVINSTKQSNSLTQTFTNLPEGRYVFSAFLKSSGGQNDVAIVAKGFNKDNDKTQVGTKMLLKTDVWSRVIVEFTVTSGNANVSIWNNANEGNWIMADDVKLYRKDTPEVQLLENGGFENFASFAPEFKLPPRAVVTITPNNSKPQSGISSGNTSGGAENSNNYSDDLDIPFAGENSSVTYLSVLGVSSLLVLCLISSKKIRKI